MLAKNSLRQIKTLYVYIYSLGSGRFCTAGKSQGQFAASTLHHSLGVNPEDSLSYFVNNAQKASDRIDWIFFFKVFIEYGNNNYRKKNI